MDFCPAIVLTYFGGKKLNKYLVLAAATLVTSGAYAQVYSNGVANGTNGVRPTANWDPQGIIHDFTVTGGNQAMANIRIELIDLTTPVGTFSTPTSVRIEFYDLGAGSIADLVHGTNTPFYDHTYTGSEFVKTLSGLTFFGGDLEYWDLTTSVYNFAAPGHFAMFMTMPGTGAVPIFWASSTPTVPGNPGAVFGPGINSQLVDPTNSEHAFTINAVPEPGTFVAIGLGLAALALRRRSK